MSQRTEPSSAARFRKLSRLVLLLAFMAGGCADAIDGSNDNLPRSTLTIARDGTALLSLEVELALTAADQQKGLMGVKSLPRSSGMAFLWSTPVRSSFTMRNTLIPLDIAFWNEDNTIVDILQMEPCREEPCDPYIAITDYVGAVEVNKGVLVAEGIQPGDKITLTRE